MTNREINVEVFEDTRRMYTHSRMLADAVRDSIARQILIREGEAVPSDQKVCAMTQKETCEKDIPDVSEAVAGQVLVSQKRTLEAAAAYARDGKKVCVLNFASATNPGGGVTKGSSAQEEAICRCSTLYPCLADQSLWEGFYKAHRKLPTTVYNDDCIYTPDVIVFKTDTAKPQMMDEKDWYKVNVITCAAPNLREHPYNAMNQGHGKSPKLKMSEIKDLHIRRGRRILETALAFGNEVIILGAFGCGAFQNPPEAVAGAYAQLVREYRDRFETIEFAVYCRPDETKNYDTFRRTVR